RHRHVPRITEDSTSSWSAIDQRVGRARLSSERGANDVGRQGWITSIRADYQAAPQSTPSPRLSSADAVAARAESFLPSSNSPGLGHVVDTVAMGANALVYKHAILFADR